MLHPPQIQTPTALPNRLILLKQTQGTLESELCHPFPQIVAEVHIPTMLLPLLLQEYIGAAEVVMNKEFPPHFRDCHVVV